MPIKFNPFYHITPQIAADLVKIESVKEKVMHLPLNAKVLLSLRESARLYTTHYSTMIEGNRLSPEEIKQVVENDQHFPGRERDEGEVKTYYKALAQVEKWADEEKKITENLIKLLHAFAMAHGTTPKKGTPYRDGQNVIKDGKTKKIVYLPPESNDVPELMHAFVDWLETNNQLPCPLRAAISHYQFATIHPYYDGNGRTARLLTTFILHRDGYDLKGIYSLEEYYARNLQDYYNAISIGTSHNYYMGRAEADITPWIEYFMNGMLEAFENVLKKMQEIKITGLQDHEQILRSLDPKQRKTLELFRKFEQVTASQIATLFNFKPRTGSHLCAEWVKNGFLEIINFSKKGRKYTLSKKYHKLIL